MSDKLFSNSPSMGWLKQQIESEQKASDEAGFPYMTPTELATSIINGQKGAYESGYQSALEDAAKFVETHYVVLGDTERIVIDISDWDEQTSSKLEQKALAAAIRQLAKETK